jgi:glycosyltransferase 2 family protein
LLKNWRFWLGLAISLVFLYWLGSQVQDLGRVLDLLARAQYVYILPALAVYFFGVWLRAVRWRYLLLPLKPVSSGRLFPVVVIGYMVNDILPARIGELARAYLIGEREGLSKSATLATIVVERVFDGLVLLGLMLAVALTMPFDSTLQQIVWATGLLFLGLLLLILAMAARPDWAEAILALGLRPVPERYRGPVAGIGLAGLTGLRALRSARTALAALALSAAAWLCETAMYYIIALGFFSNVNVRAMLLTTSVANVGGMIPSSPGYVGTFDALAVFSLGLFGVGRELALGYTAVLHLALLLPITLLGFFYLWRENLSLRGLSKARLQPSLPADGPAD